MRRLALALLLALPQLGLGQTASGPGIGPSGAGIGAGSRLAPYTALFRAPGCVPTGTILSPSTPLTVTRASVQYVDRPNSNQTTPGLIAEDANTVAHVYWNGSALVDTKGNAWTQNGTVPQNAATWNAPPSAGPYSAANNYQGPTSLMDMVDGFAVTVVYTPTVLQSGTVASRMSFAATEGWLLDATATGQLRGFYHSGSLVNFFTANSHLLGTANVASYWRVGSTCYLQLNSGTVASAACGAVTTAGANPPRIGVFGTTGSPLVGGSVHEVFASTGQTSVTQAALQASVMAKINQVTLTSCPANSLAVDSNGGSIWAQGVNYALQSQTIATAGTNTITAPWTRTAANVDLVGAAALGPDGTMSLTSVNNATAGNTHGITQAVTIASSASAASCNWASKGSTGTVTGTYVCTAGTASSCTCTTSDGSACSTAVATTTCTAKFTAVGSTPVRACLMPVCAAALTGPTVGWYPGEISVSTGTANFGLASVEVGSYPTPYIPTTTGTGTRNATVASVPAPDISNDVWCEAQTYKPGQAWNTAGTRYIGSNYAGVAANSIDIYKDATNIVLAVTSDAGATKTITYAHGLTTATTAKRIVACNASGTLSLYVDGTSVGTAGGAGTGTQTATLTPWQIGARNGAGQIDGSVTGQKFCPNASYSGCR